MASVIAFSSALYLLGAYYITQVIRKWAIHQAVYNNSPQSQNKLAGMVTGAWVLLAPVSFGVCALARNLTTRVSFSMPSTETLVISGVVLGGAIILTLAFVGAKFLVRNEVKR